MPVITVGKPLRDKLGDEAVDSLVELINQSLGEQKNNIIELVEEKFERRLSEEFVKLEKRIIETEKKLDKRISDVEQNLGKRISSIEVEIAKNYAQTIKWMFIFWVGQVGVILGILFAFFK